MRIFLDITGILILLSVPFFIKTRMANKVFTSFFLGFAAIIFLINIEFFSPDYPNSREDIMVCFINWAAYLAFGLISLLIHFIKPENRKEYFFFFPAIAAFTVFIFTSFDELKYSLAITGNILLVFLPFYTYLFYLKYKVKKFWL